MNPPIKLRRLYARDGGKEFVIVAEPLPAHVRSCMSDEEIVVRNDAEREAIDAEWKRIREST